MIEVRMRGARGDDEEVVRELAVGHRDDAAIGVDRLHVAHDDADVLLFSQYRADRRGDVARIQRGGGDLIEQRLEEVVVAAVDERDVGVRLCQRLRRVQAAEAAADDYDSFGRHREPVSRGDAESAEFTYASQQTPPQTT